VIGSRPLIPGRNCLASIAASAARI